MRRGGTARRSERSNACDSGLDFRIQQHGVIVVAALSGHLDRSNLTRLIRRVAPALGRRGCRVILDGAALEHVDFRAVRPLLEWNRLLRSFGHRLYLHRWSGYLKAIICVEDPDCELQAGALGWTRGSVLAGLGARRWP